MSAEGQELNLDNIIDQDQDRLTTDELIAQAEKDGVSMDDLFKIHESHKNETDTLTEESVQQIKKYESDVSKALLSTGVTIPEHIFKDSVLFADFSKKLTELSGLELATTQELLEKVRAGICKGNADCNFMLKLNSEGKVNIEAAIDHTDKNVDIDFDEDSLEAKELEKTDVEKMQDILADLKDPSLVIENGRVYVSHKCPDGKIHRGYFTIGGEGNPTDLANVQDWKANRIKGLERKYPKVEIEDNQKTEEVQEVVEKEEKVEEIVEIKSLEDLKTSLSDKKIVKESGDYYFVPKSFDTNNQTDKQAIIDDVEGVSSLEDILKIIDEIPGIDLAFDESMNEKEKLKLISDAIGHNFAEGDAELHTESFSTIELDADFKEGMYSKEKFEEKLIKELNKIIPEDIIRSAEQTIEQAIVDEVNKKLESYGVQGIEAKDLLLTHKNKVADLIKDVDIFDKIPTAATVIVANGLFKGVPSEIDDNAMYEVNNGQEGDNLQSVKMSGAKLKELLAANDKKVASAMEDNRESIKIDETKLALEKLGFTEFKDIDFEGFENGKYEFSYDGETIYVEKRELQEGMGDVFRFNTKYEDIWEVYEQNIDQETFEGGIKELSKRVQAKEAQDEIVQDQDEDNKVEKKQENREKEKSLKQQEREMKKFLSKTEFSVVDLFGKDARDMDVSKDTDTLLWLNEFSKSDLSSGLDLSDIDVDLSKNEITFDFDDSYSNEDFNEKHKIDISGMVTDGKLDMDAFKKALANSAKDAVQRMRDEK